MDYTLITIDTTKIFIFVVTVVSALALIWVAKKTIHTITYS